MALYANAYLGINGTIVVQETTLSVAKKAGMNPVFTTALGFAGMSQGAPIMEVSFESAVPSADFEFNPDRYMLLGEEVDVSILMAGRQTNTKGFITEATYTHGVNQEAKLSMSIICRFERFE